MYDILINAVRLAFSEDARKSVSAIVDLIQRSPDWEKDICTLEAKVEATHREHADLLAGLTMQKLQNLDFSEEAREAFRTTFAEMAVNAFEYGSNKDQSIGVVIEICSEYVSTTIKNARGHNFQLDHHLDQRRHIVASNPNSDRGRGLLLIECLSDSLEQIGHSGVKAVVYRERVSLSKYSARNVTVFLLNGGLRNPSLGRRLTAVIPKELSDYDVILDLSKFFRVSVETRLIGAARRLSSAANDSGHIFVVVGQKGTSTEALTLFGSTFCEGLLDACNVLGLDRAEQAKLARAGVNALRVV